MFSFGGTIVKKFNKVYIWERGKGSIESQSISLFWSFFEARTMGGFNNLITVVMLLII
jgi:hypothetical protein